MATAATTSVEVRDNQGTVLGKARVGDTKLQALERLGRLGAGGLFDREDDGLLDGDTISSNDSPYVFKSTTNPQEALRKNDDSTSIFGDGVYTKLTRAVCFFRAEAVRSVRASPSRLKGCTVLHTTLLIQSWAPKSSAILGNQISTSSDVLQFQVWIFAWITALWIL